MKIRSYLEIKKSKYIFSTIAISSIPFFLILYLNLNSLLVFLLILFSAISCLAILNRNVRCPACNATLGWRVFSDRGPGHISNKFSSCRRCHVSFEDDIEKYGVTSKNKN